MRKPFRLLALPLFAFLFVLGGCILSPEESVDPPPDDSGPRLEELPLTSKTNVINNLAFAYGNRNIDAYRKILDDDFVFLFQEADANNPNPDERTPVEWYRTDEINATTNLFDENFSDPEQPPADEIVLRIPELESLTESSWGRFEGVKHVTDPSTWYELDVRYDLEVQVGEDRLLAEDRAKFIVRQVDVEGGGQEWRLVHWSDLEDI